MRLRFSLRLIFVAVTLVAVALYWFVARPTVLANRFVAAIEKRDYETAKSLLRGNAPWPADTGTKPLAEVDLVYAELLPREWHDLGACRRRIIFRVAYHHVSGRSRIEWSSDSDGVATSRGIELSDPSLPQTIAILPAEP